MGRGGGGGDAAAAAAPAAGEGEGAAEGGGAGEAPAEEEEAPTVIKVVQSSMAWTQVDDAIEVRVRPDMPSPRAGEGLEREGGSRPRLPAPFRPSRRPPPPLLAPTLRLEPWTSPPPTPPRLPPPPPPPLRLGMHRRSLAGVLPLPPWRHGSGRGRAGGEGGRMMSTVVEHPL